MAMWGSGSTIPRWSTGPPRIGSRLHGDGRLDGSSAPYDRDRPRGLRPTRSRGRVKMTTKLSLSLSQPLARGRIRMLAVATAVALATVAALGAATSRATVGAVYFDANENAAAGDPTQFFDPAAPTFFGDNN